MADSTERIGQLLKGDIKVLNLGSKVFADSLAAQGARVVHAEWSMPCSGNLALLAVLGDMRAEATLPAGGTARLQDVVDKANARALNALGKSHPYIVGIGRALDVIPGMRERLILHAGPATDWERMCGPVRGAVMGALICEGLADTPEQAANMAGSGRVLFEPAQHHSAVCSSAGVISSSMPVWIVENRLSGKRAFSVLTGGGADSLSVGAFSGDVIDRRRWIQNTLAPVLAEALRIHGDVDLKAMMVSALRVLSKEDDAASACGEILARALAPAVSKTGAAEPVKVETDAFLRGAEPLFRSIAAAAAKCCMDTVAGTDWSSLVTAMGSNGTDFGIKVAGLGDTWLIEPAPRVTGQYSGGYSDKDANPTVGDDGMRDTYGIAWMNACALWREGSAGHIPGDSSGGAFRFAQVAYEIAAGESTHFVADARTSRGAPVGIDVIKVIENGILPALSTSILHKDPGIGRIGHGIVYPPANCFKDAFMALYDKVKQARLKM